MSNRRKIAIVISGLLRSFNNKLLPFLNQLPDNYDIYLLTSNPLTDFINKKLVLDDFLTHNKIKEIVIEKSLLNLPDNLSKRDKNIVNQLYKIKRHFDIIPKTYDIYVKCRPDVNFKCNITDFISIVEQPLDEKTIIIPNGFDIYDIKLLDRVSIDDCINDHIAISNFEVMSIYSEVYNNINIEETPIISEKYLKTHLTKNNIKIKRIDLPYSICFSQCKTISICGDSGSGKSYLSNIINEILPFNETLLFETDRYHKWERGDSNYKTYTHLNPEANYLEKLTSDVYELSLGNDIFAVDYDHSTGKFTEPKFIKSNNCIILCGLHTLYNNSLKEISDIKIYLDTDPKLKLNWKINRDISERNHSTEKIINSIKEREYDLKKFIEPQKENADVIVSYKCNDTLNMFLIISISKNISNYIDILNKVSSIVNNIIETEFYIELHIKNDITSEYLKSLIKEVPYIQNIKDSFDGVIQYIILLLLWNC